MSVIFLTEGGGTRETAMRAAIEAKGWQLNSERYAFVDPEVVGWGIKDPPCVIGLHRGKAVWEHSEAATLPLCQDGLAAIQAAIDAFDQANP